MVEARQRRSNALMYELQRDDVAALLTTGCQRRLAAICPTKRSTSSPDLTDCDQSIQDCRRADPAHRGTADDKPTDIEEGRRVLDKLRAENRMC